MQVFTLLIQQLKMPENRIPKNLFFLTWKLPTTELLPWLHTLYSLIPAPMQERVSEGGNSWKRKPWWKVEQVYSLLKYYNNLDSYWIEHINQSLSSMNHILFPGTKYA